MFDRAGVGVAQGFGAFEDRRQRVVILLRDRIKLVVVAADAAERHSQEGFAERVQLLVDDVHFQLLAIRFGQHLCAE